MDREINSLIGNSLAATDGIIGEVKDFYFDDETWVIRYLVVRTGSWLFGREVLISPIALKNSDRVNKIIQVNLTREQIQNSPDIDTKQPVSRQQEAKLYGHYQWESYWGSGFYAGGYSPPGSSSPIIDRTVLTEPVQDHKNSAGDIHLRSTERITGYRIHAEDGEIGHVNTFIINDETLRLLFFVVDTNNWIGGKKVLIPVQQIKTINWTRFEVFLNMTTAEVNDSRLFEGSEFVRP